MKSAEIRPSVLDDVVQQTISSLHQSREQLGRIADAAGRQYQNLRAEIAEIKQQLKADRTSLSGLAKQEQAAVVRLAEIIESGPIHTTAIMAAIDNLTEAKVASALFQERMVGLQDRLAELEGLAEGLRAIGEESGVVSERLEHSSAFVSSHFKDLGVTLESAQQSRALGLHVIRAQEEERRRLAREIHDGPTQLLNSVVLRIDVCQRFFETDMQRLREELQQLKDLVRLSLQEMRKLIFDLRPMTLDDLGLVPALRAFLKDYQAKTGIDTDFVVFGNDRRYDPSFEVAIFRLVQEALTNANKHAGASRVWVKVETTGGREIKVSVKDDGAGFEPEKVRRDAAGTKFGLVAMKERTELLGGSMEILSAPGQGTKLNFVFPLND